MTRLNGKPLRILQITDCHLGRDADESLLGLTTVDTLVDVLERAVEVEDSFDLVLCSGDISNDGTTGSYDRFIQIVRQHLPAVPLAWLPGNHDDPASMRAIRSAAPRADYLSIGGWNVILLNSRVPFEERGELPQSELKRLERLLESDPLSPTMIFLHHQLVPVGSAWIDQYVVSNAADFFAITDRFDNVRAVSWGHVHQEFYMVRNGVDLIATPSTCVQFKPLSDDFMVDSTMPGYRTYELQANGVYTTHVNRVTERAYSIDLASEGY
ncbi:MAG: 3',5'-cyclic-AMP phosphodiesterase [Cellvibrionaceae bacterium]|nr:3',5'-cyclic-AMP phosphodiesterase [Cellvibrionaceae bacterium]